MLSAGIPVNQITVRISSQDPGNLSLLLLGVKNRWFTLFDGKIQLTFKRLFLYVKRYVTSQRVQTDFPHDRPFFHKGKHFLCPILIAVPRMKPCGGNDDRMHLKTIEQPF